MRDGAAMALATAYVGLPPSPVSAQKSSHNSGLSAKCSKVNPSPAWGGALSPPEGTVAVAACKNTRHHQSDFTILDRHCRLMGMWVVSSAVRVFQTLRPSMVTCMVELILLHAVVSCVMTTQGIVRDY